SAARDGSMRGTRRGRCWARSPPTSSSWAPSGSRGARCSPRGSPSPPARPPSPAPAGSHSLAAAGPAIAVPAGATLRAPRFRPWDRALMPAGVYQPGLEWRERPGFHLRDFLRERRLLFYEEGREAVVAVSEREGTDRRFLSVNGKTDAGSGAE